MFGECLSSNVLLGEYHQLQVGFENKQAYHEYCSISCLTAPNTPLRGRSVRPSTSASTRAASVARTSSSHRSGYKACHRAVSAGSVVSLLPLFRANFNNLTAAQKRRGLLLGPNGRPHPSLSLSIGMLMKTSSPSALLLSPINHSWSEVHCDSGFQCLWGNAISKHTIRPVWVELQGRRLQQGLEAATQTPSGGAAHVSIACVQYRRLCCLE